MHVYGMWVHNTHLKHRLQTAQESSVGSTPRSSIFTSIVPFRSSATFSLPCSPCVWIRHVRSPCMRSVESSARSLGMMENYHMVIATVKPPFLLLATVATVEE